MVNKLVNSFFHFRYRINANALWEDLWRTTIRWSLKVFDTKFKVFLSRKKHKTCFKNLSFDIILKFILYGSRKFIKWIVTDGFPSRPDHNSGISLGTNLFLYSFTRTAEHSFLSVSRILITLSERYEK